MPQSSPYQPILLRSLHGAIAVLVLLALVSGFWVYNTYDKRWGSLALPQIADIQGLHGTIAVTFLGLFPVFVLYCFHLGYRRLIQGSVLPSAKALGKPAGWVALHRLANTLMLLAATLAIITGRMMQEAWLPAGEVNHTWYLAHLGAWLGLCLSFLLHLLLGAKVGGLPLLTSMFQWQRSAADSPTAWLQGVTLYPPSLSLRIIEGLVIGGIGVGLILPVFNR